MKIEFNKIPKQMSNANLDSAEQMVIPLLEAGQTFTMMQLIKLLEENDYSESIARYLFWRMNERGKAKINMNWAIEKY
jgi:hypothetical protein